MVIYNANIIMQDIPLEAYDYVVNGKPALDWVIERQVVKTDKKSGITNDANRYANETVGDPAYPLELFKRVITVSLETMKIVRSPAEVGDRFMSGEFAGTGDKGAHYHRCDLQVHSPRDCQWKGAPRISDDDRAEYAASLIAACREKELDAIAITDHHDMVFVRYVRQAAEQETDHEGSPLSCGSVRNSVSFL